MITSELLTNLNRLGIVLNVISGFLMAPDIIGKERLNIWEQKIENSIHSLTRKLYNIKRVLVSRIPSFNLDPFSSEPNYEKKQKSVQKFIRLSIIVSGIYSLFIVIIYTNPHLSKKYGVFIFNYAFLIPTICTGIILFFDKVLYERYYFVYLKFINNITAIIFGIAWIYALLFLFLNFGFIVGILSITLLSVLKCFEFCLSYTLKKMDGKGKFASIFLIVGIILFILGNFFQLLSTFN